MRDVISFVVPGDPQGKGRPRAARTRKGLRMYTPKRTEAYEDLVALLGKQAMAGHQPLEGPQEVELGIAVRIPASWPKKRKASALAGLELPAKTPDIDNIIKAICDGLNGVAWIDDAQVVDVIARKRYGEQPGVTVTIRGL